MSLNWNLGPNADKIRELYPPTSDGYQNVVTYTIIMLTMGTGIGNLTEANAAEFFARASVSEKLHGPFLRQADGKPQPLTPADVAAHIGLTTNVFPTESRTAWTKRVFGNALDDATYRFRSDMRRAAESEVKSDLESSEPTTEPGPTPTRADPTPDLPREKRQHAFPNQPDPLGDQIRLLSDEITESSRRKSGLALTAVVRAIREVYPNAIDLSLVRGSHGLPVLDSVTIRVGHDRIMIADRTLRQSMGWSDHRSHTYRISFEALVESGLTDVRGPIATFAQEGPSGDIVTEVVVNIDDFLALPLSLWYPRRPGEPQLGPDGHRNAVLAVLYPPVVPAPTAPADDLANA